MKIRTDFVTNSSSSSFCTIEINSPTVAHIFAEMESQYESSGIKDWAFWPPFDKLKIDDSAVLIEEYEDSWFRYAPDGISALGTALYSCMEDMFSAGDWFDDEGNPAINAHEMLKSSADEIAKDTHRVSWSYRKQVRGEFADEPCNLGEWQTPELEKARDEVAEKFGIASSDVSDEQLKVWLCEEAVATYEVRYEYDAEKGVDTLRKGWKLGY